MGKGRTGKGGEKQEIREREGEIGTE